MFKFGTAHRDRWPQRQDCLERCRRSTDRCTNPCPSRPLLIGSLCYFEYLVDTSGIVCPAPPSSTISSLETFPNQQGDFQMPICIPGVVELTSASVVGAPFPRRTSALLVERLALGNYGPRRRRFWRSGTGIYSIDRK